MIKPEECLFPHSVIRESQHELIVSVMQSLSSRTPLVVHAPTGLGKTAATISPALQYALANKKKVFFLTSRHTQHMIVVNTLRQIKKKFKIEFVVSDIIGKKHLCCQSNVENLYSNEFTEYCKNLREHGKCEFYTNTKDKSGKITKGADGILQSLKKTNPHHAEDILSMSKKDTLCGYEMAALLAKDSDVIIADYSYIFNPTIKQSFFKRLECAIEDCIIIVDEGHNLPKRCREVLTTRISSFMIERAIQEAEKFGYNNFIEILQLLRQIISKFGEGLYESNNEVLISKEKFSTLIKVSYDYEQIIEELSDIADDIREKQRVSFIGSIAQFLESWKGQDEGFARILTKQYGKQPQYVLSYRCLDPSLVTKEIVENCHALLVMSGTLTPTFMYKDVLGIPKGIEKEFKSPFPNENRLNLVIPYTTTKYAQRDAKQFQAIAGIAGALSNQIKGNCAIFFPSYAVRDSVKPYFEPLCTKTIFNEVQGLTKQEKEDMLDRFKEYKNTGAVLLGVAAGNFGEGVDLPGDLLNGVIVIGIPLQKPDLETKELMHYYDKKFGKGWDYGYILPAITKILQNAGRCIRSETDKGIIAFVDERFIEKKYLSCFPPDWDIKITKNFSEEIEKFYGKEETKVT